MKKINDYIHLYLGCDGQAEFNYDGKVQCVNCKFTGMFYDGQLVVKCKDKNGIEWANSSMVFPDQFKPILRPLTDMTEEESLKWAEMKERFWNDKLMSVFNTAELIHWLLSKHFDIFNLINEELAIDKTTLK